MKTVVILTPLKMGNLGGGQRPEQLAFAFCASGFRVIVSSRNSDHIATEWGAVVRSLPKITGLPEWPPMIDEQMARLAKNDIDAFVEGKYLVINCWNSAWNADLLQEQFFRDLNAFTVWDIADLWEEFDYDKYQIETERNLVKNSHAITATAKRLCRIFGERYSREINYLPNAFNSHILRKREHGDYERYREIVDTSKLTFFYVGTLYRDSMDWSLIRQLSSFGKKTAVYIAGPFEGIEPQIKKSAGIDIFDLPNVHFLGEIGHDEILCYTNLVDFCLQPFIPDSEMVQCISPIKIFTYIAGGGRVISSAMEEVEGMPNVIIYKCASELSYEYLLQIKHSPMDPLRDFISNNSWNSRVGVLESIYESRIENRLSRLSQSDDN